MTQRLTPEDVSDKIFRMWKVIGEKIFFASSLDDRFMSINNQKFIAIYKLEPLPKTSNPVFDLKHKNEFFDFYLIKSAKGSDLYGYVIVPQFNKDSLFRITNRCIVFTNKEMDFETTQSSKIIMVYNDDFLTILKIGSAFVITDLTKLLNIM